MNTRSRIATSWCRVKKSSRARSPLAVPSFQMSGHWQSTVLGTILPRPALCRMVSQESACDVVMEPTNAFMAPVAKWKGRNALPASMTLGCVSFINGVRDRPLFAIWFREWSTLSFSRAVEVMVPKMRATTIKRPRPFFRWLASASVWYPWMDGSGSRRSMEDSRLAVDWYMESSSSSRMTSICGRQFFFSATTSLRPRRASLARDTRSPTTPLPLPQSSCWPARRTTRKTMHAMNKAIRA
mmetsp:Transcript_7629/g.17572  ORF Transcript_7629/g.17572 Transcript_7629/m.17572 type:complete len:241 (-) Transcript_7629:1952-2674(-)